MGADRDYRTFLTRHAPQVLAPGAIIDQQGKTLGYHQGLAFYTIGQRKGIRIASQTPLYVIAKDPAQNAVIVGPADARGKYTLSARSANWIKGEPPATPFECQVKVRYKARDVTGVVNEVQGNSFKIEFSNPVRDITPGQAAVLYNDKVCLGGGIITDEM